MPKAFSHANELAYYSRTWPTTAKTYDHLEKYLRWLDSRTVFGGKRLLDVGAGECEYTRLISTLWRPRHATACDLFLERMQPAADLNQDCRLRFVSGDCYRLPFGTGVFDVVFGSFVLCQLPQLDRIAAEISRVLDKKGSYIGIEPNPYYVRHVWRFLGGRRSRNQYLLRAAHLRAFANAGFRVRIRYFNARLPVLRHRLVTTCIGITASRDE